MMEDDIVNLAEQDAFALAYQPMIIKGKRNERLWYVDGSQQRCVDICRMQLKVKRPH
jgi:hypothetical protein